MFFKKLLFLVLEDDFRTSRLLQMRLLWIRLLVLQIRLLVLHIRLLVLTEQTILQISVLVLQIRLLALQILLRIKFSMMQIRCPCCTFPFHLWQSAPAERESICLTLSPLNYFPCSARVNFDQIFFFFVQMETGKKLLCKLIRNCGLLQ